jgi:hypothetical protein
MEGGIAHFILIGLYWKNSLWRQNYNHLFFLNICCIMAYVFR